MLTLAGTSIGLFVWLILWFVSRRRALSSRVLTGLLFGIGLACRLVFLIGTPTFYAPDEQPHYNYVRYLADHRAFPVQNSRTDDPSNDWEYYQPPLYYLSLVPLYWAADALWGNPDLTVRLLRGISILLWGATFWLSQRILNRLRPGDEAVRSFALGLVCLLPTYAFISSSLNNDNLLIALGSAVLLLSLDLTKPDLPGSDRLKRSLLLGFVLGLALLTKLTAVVYLAWLGGLFLIVVGRACSAPVLSSRYHDRETVVAPPKWTVLVRHAIPFLITIAVAALMWAPWSWRNLVIYGSLTAEAVANVPREWPSTGHALSASLHYMHNSFWSVSGIYNNVHGTYHRIGIGISLIAAGGWLVGFAKRGKEALLLAGRQIGITLAMILAIFVNAALVLRFGVLYGQAQGRFLFPLLLPIALLLGTGLRLPQILPVDRARIHLAGIQIVYLVSFTAYSLGTFPRQ
jgi:hypothetical protein